MSARTGRPSPIGSAAVARIVSSEVSVSRLTVLASSARRSARSLTCNALSSPETYNVACPAASSREATCNSRVLFPMPGSPPTSTMLPGTIPPPRTKSNSSSPVRHRGVSAAVTAPSATVRATVPAADLAVVLLLVMTGVTISSANVFHALQLSHRPAHFGASAPHSVHR